MIRKLVEFDTTSRNSNLELIDFVVEYLKSFGVQSRLVFNKTKSKANLLATVGPNSPGGIVLSGHSDVVPVDGQNWRTDPFKLVVEDDKLYGRGTADMKSFCAIALSAVPKFLEAKLNRPIHLAFSYDEEVGCIGARDLVPLLNDTIGRPEAIIVGEPTSMEVATAHKGIKCMKTDVRGVEAHSAYSHRGESAIIAASRLVSYLGDLANKYKKNGVRDERFDPPYTTINIGDIVGGSAINIIPNHCTFNWEHRPVPGQDPNEIPLAFQDFAENIILKEMSVHFEGCSVNTKEWAFVPAFQGIEGSSAELLVKSLAEKNSTTVIPFTTEAGLYQNIDIPTVVCGPGSMDQGHKPNEFITLDQVRRCEVFMDRLANALSI